MSGAPAPAASTAAPPVDHTEELAKKLFIELCAHIYSAPGGSEQGKPQPKAVVAMSFKLAEAFVAGNFEFNSVARAAREANEKASVDINKVEIDFSSFNKK